MPANTDDRNRVEFGFARSLGQDSFFSVDEIERVARERRGKPGRDRRSGLDGRQPLACHGGDSVGNRRPSVRPDGGRAAVDFAQRFFEGGPSCARELARASRGSRGDRSRRSCWRRPLPRAPRNSPRLSSSGCRARTPSKRRSRPRAAALARGGTRRRRSSSSSGPSRSIAWDPWAMPVVVKNAFAIVLDLASGDAVLAARAGRRSRAPSPWRFSTTTGFSSGWRSPRTWAPPGTRRRSPRWSPTSLAGAGARAPGAPPAKRPAVRSRREPEETSRSFRERTAALRAGSRGRREAVAGTGWSSPWPPLRTASSSPSALTACRLAADFIFSWTAGFRTRTRMSISRAAAGRPRRCSRRSMAIVRAGAAPGTGVIQAARAETDSKSTSPTRTGPFGRGRRLRVVGDSRRWGEGFRKGALSRLTPTSTTTAPSPTKSPATNAGFPIATMRMRRPGGRSPPGLLAREWREVTVASRDVGSAPMPGLPTLSAPAEDDGVSPRRAVSRRRPAGPGCLRPCRARSEAAPARAGRRSPGAGRPRPSAGRGRRRPSARRAPEAAEAGPVSRPRRRHGWRARPPRAGAGESSSPAGGLSRRGSRPPAPREVFAET